MGDGGAGGDGGDEGLEGLAALGAFGEEADMSEGLAALGDLGEAVGTGTGDFGGVSTPSVPAPDVGGGVPISKSEKPEEKPEEKVKDIKKPKVITRAKRRRSLFTEEEPTVYRRSLLGR